VRLACLLVLLAACVDAGGGAPEAAGDGGAPGDGVRFDDVTAEAGGEFTHAHGGAGKKFLFETMGSGVALADLDGDAWTDLLLLQSGTLPADEFTEAERERAPHDVGAGHALYRNRGDGTLQDVTAGSGLERPHYAMGPVVGDVDADGDRDLYVTTYGRDRMFRNEGGLRFTDVTAASGIDEERWTIAGTFFDKELDGDLDLYVVGYLDMPIDAHRFCGPNRRTRMYCHVDSWPGIPDRLWDNDGTGRFTDATAAAGLADIALKGLAVIATDLDLDGDADLFVANDSTANTMLRNEGDGTFTDVGRLSGTDYNGEGKSEACMGVDSGDYDEDGDLDLYVVNFQQESNTLYRNDGGGFFTDVSTRSGAGEPSRAKLGFGCAFLDVDLDTDLDLYVANGHIMDNIAEVETLTTFAQVDQLYLNEGGRFAPADPACSPSARERRVGRGVATGDLDRDGRPDVVVTNNGEAPWILRNVGPAGRRLELVLRGPDGRADAEGARVEVRLGDRTLLREVRGGGSYVAHHDTTLLVGLGDATVVDALTIRWPGGGTSRWEALPADLRLVVAFGGEVLERTALPAAGPP